MELSDELQILALRLHALVSADDVSRTRPLRYDGIQSGTRPCKSLDVYRRCRSVVVDTIKNCRQFLHG